MGAFSWITEFNTLTKTLAGNRDMVVPKNVEKTMTHTNEAKCQIAMVDGGRKN